MLLIVPFKKTYQQVHCCFPLSVIKLLSAVSSEPKQQVRRPVISTIVDRYMSNIQNDKRQPNCLSAGKLKMSTIFVLELKSAKNNKLFNYLNGRFSVMGGSMDMIFGVFSETIVRLLKSIILQFFSKYSKSYNILDSKSCLKIKGS